MKVNLNFKTTKQIAFFNFTNGIKTKLQIQVLFRSEDIKLVTYNEERNH